METRSGYLLEQSCDLAGLEHEWHVKTDTGDFGGWGQGTMKSRTCARCTVVEYVQFTDEDGRTVDIDLLAGRARADKLKRGDMHGHLRP